jgi:predicted metal-binding membrane protein
VLLGAHARRFAVGAGNLHWMAALTTVMVAERAARWGRAVVRPLGAAFLVVAPLLLVHPAWLPAALGTG